ncbi:PP2C family serine/threonine-protein phosphatase [Chryseobacterium sp. BIGb0232]|uniref:PP2C family serine/threonine-protein phosphatase n=1 Tax=Chryseobacterium sp. BIGb0232 TaxID=2940598 RepID=UPI000F49AD29|nr:PP2C family serine/threonine-protein phosphatase [Chryseobacterium sp. BIGb0232]MCS4301738.1 serine/threonine protein phosphatase PrpC [Chryseobacterium sp. BIGb0232]ROS19408.1 protein phosphatase 2C-like protein [Chryseobacterium nakagawai]
MKIPSFYFGIGKKPMEKGIIYKEKEEFKEVHWVLKNANAGKFYEFSFEIEDFPNIKIKTITNLEVTGLMFENNRISGTPMANNLYHLDIEFFHIEDKENTEIKRVQLLVNIDPKDLWKNVPADKEADFYKEDEASFQGRFSDKKIVVVSKRGRSHAHEGKFREDDFAVNELPSDWNIVSVSDGAGSATMAREGSRLATISVNEFFSSPEVLNEIENNIEIIYTSDNSEKEQDGAKEHVIRRLYEGVLYVHHALEKTASENNLSMNDLHTTLIFALVKKFSFGYVILNFGVGDCPISLVNTDFSEIKLLNIMDVGEFSGGTRFMTMKEIFNDHIVSRFRISCVEDFSYLVLMTDGIYDPKFLTESKLEDTESWKTFFNDLNGANDDLSKVNFINDTEIAQQLLHWTDFWSRGNHDDRTLAIIY